jgi:hypothetical protein
VKGAIAIGLAAALAACGADDRKPTASLPGGGAKDAGASEAGADAGVTEVTSAIPWQLVATLAIDADALGDPSELAESDGWLYPVWTQRRAPRFRLEDGHADPFGTTGDPGGLYETGRLCTKGDLAVFLGGGGNGIFSTFDDFHTEVLDLASGAWQKGFPAGLPYHLVGVARDGGRCFQLGGDNGGGISPTPDVQELVVDTGQWVQRAPMPRALARAQGAFDAGRLVVAGGARKPEGGDTGWSDQGIPVADAWSLEVDAPGATWTPIAKLPSPRDSGRLFAWRGRFWLVGGETSGKGLSMGGLVHAVVSWAPGEAAWREDGLLPIANANGVFPAPAGDALYVVVTAGTPAEARLYRWRP